MGLVACHDCDLLHELGPLPEGSTASCTRCGGVLRKRARNGLERALALSVAAAVLFVVANSFPFLSFEMKGRVTQTNVTTGIIDLWNGGKPEIAVLVAMTILVAPVAQLSLLLWVLGFVRMGRIPPALPIASRLLAHATSWSMIEVFMVGIIVAIPKLMGMASIVPGLALWSFALLMIVLSAAISALDTEEVWERVEAMR